MVSSLIYNENKYNITYNLNGFWHVANWVKILVICAYFFTSPVFYNRIFFHVFSFVLKYKIDDKCEKKSLIAQTIP